MCSVDEHAAVRRLQFLLIVPVLTDRPPVGSERVTSGYATRNEHRAADLRQQWETTESEQEEILGSWRVLVGHREVHVLVVEHEFHGDVAAAERALTVMGQTEAVAHVSDGESPWVNRTLLRCETCPEVPGWRVVRGDDEGFVIAEADTSAACAVLEVRPGWGNGEVVLSAPVRDARSWISENGVAQVVAGMIDAQVVWVGIEALALDSRQLVRSLRSSDQGRLKQSLTQAESAALAFAEQRLVHDELLVDIQGRRQDVAMATLRSWRYDEIVERVSRRLDDATGALRQRVDARTQQQQSRVGWIGFGLSLLLLFDLALSFISTAFSGQSDAVGRESGLFSLIRTSDSDVVLALVLGVLVLVSVSTLIRGRK